MSAKSDSRRNTSRAMRMRIIREWLIWCCAAIHSSCSMAFLSRAKDTGLVQSFGSIILSLLCYAIAYDSTEKQGVFLPGYTSRFAGEGR